MIFTRPLRSVVLALICAATVGTAPADPFLWLEDVNGPRAMHWVHAENAKTLSALQSDPNYPGIERDAQRIATASDRIPLPQHSRGLVYNFWQDPAHVRGILRRTTLADYHAAHPHWHTVLDVDALARREHANWVFEGANCREPDEDRCLIALSAGGEDAQTLREFDVRTERFVPHGFVLPRGKQDAVWEDGDTLLVARAWQPGQLTASGYPYVVKRLHRGEPLASATFVASGTPRDVSVRPSTLTQADGTHVELVGESPSFFEDTYSLVTPQGVRAIAWPRKIDPDALVAGRLVAELREDWTADGTHYRAGSLVAFTLADLMSDPAHPHPTLVYAPGARESVDAVAATRTQLLVVIDQNVRGRAFRYTPQPDGTWPRHALAFPDDATIGIADTNLNDDIAFVSVTSFLIPPTLSQVDLASGSIMRVKSSPARFDTSRDVVEQHEATSTDGTRIPYFIVHPRGMSADGANPTLLYAYGGFNVTLNPTYSPLLGKLWLERGGVYVLANIRGGGEFGPAWHDAGLNVHRQRIYDDFASVARDLIARKITSPRRLGIQGGSNGGLLMGVEFTQHPELFHAVDIQVPLLDMLRFERIAAGASWVGEYGSVSVPAQRAFLARISPYNNLHAGVAYPKPLIWTTTKDDRVGPQHARKFAAKLASMGIPYYFYEVTEGGHGAGANLAERAHTTALEMTYFVRQLMN